MNIQRAVEPVNVSDILLEYNSKVLKDDAAGNNPALFKVLIMPQEQTSDLSLKDIIELSITKEKLFQILYK